MGAIAFRVCDGIVADSAAFACRGFLKLRQSASSVRTSAWGFSEYGWWEQERFDAATVPLADP